MKNNCPYCQSEEPVIILDFISHRQFTAMFCCEQLQGDWDEVSTNQDELKAFAEHYGLDEIYGSSVDKIITDGTESSGHKNTHTHGLEGVLLSTKLTVGEITQKEMKEFVNTHHRHTKAPTGWKFGVGLYNGGELIGVASVGRPVSRMIQQSQPQTIEVNRLCVNPNLDHNLIMNACSKLYAECAKRAAKRNIANLKDPKAYDENGKEITYNKIITYILETEPGTSLKAVGWEIEYIQESSGSWDSETRSRESLPTDDITKVRWSKSI